MEMDLYHTQLTVLLCLLLGNILFGSLPLVLGRIIGRFSCDEEAWCRKVKWSTFLLYVGAGVFITDSFLVLLPQANQEFKNAKKHHHNETGNPHFNTTRKHDHHHHDAFPIPELVVLSGFFLAYVLQEAVRCLCSKLNRIPREPRDTRVTFCSCAKRHTECSRTFKDARPDQTLFGMQKKLMESGNAANPIGILPEVPLEVEKDAKAELLRSSILAQAVPNYGTVTNVTEQATDNPLPALTAPVLVLAEERRLAMAKQAEKTFRNKFLISSMTIVITLTLQYIFIGIRLGLQTEHFQRWQYLLLICLQNFMLTFSAGSYLAVGDMELCCAGLLIALLSAVSPIGLAVVMLESNAIEQIPKLATGIVQATACGSLMYSTFYEMLRQNQFVSVVGLTKFSAVAVGATVMIALQYGTSIL